MSCKDVIPDRTSPAFPFPAPFFLFKSHILNLQQDLRVQSQGRPGCSLSTKSHGARIGIKNPKPVLGKLGTDRDQIFVIFMGLLRFFPSCAKFFPCLLMSGSPGSRAENQDRFSC